VVCRERGDVEDRLGELDRGGRDGGGRRR
jgi:hypothetical protein